MNSAPHQIRRLRVVAKRKQTVSDVVKGLCIVVLEFPRHNCATFDMNTEIVWRTLLSVFMAAVLPIGSVSNGHASTTCNRNMSMDELGRAAVAAAGIFEGRLEVLGGPPASLSSLFAAGQLNATFSFRRRHKGKFKRIMRASPRPQVVVKLGLNGVRRPDSVVTGCSLSALLEPHRNYLVFVGQSSRSESSEGQSGVVLFQSTALPVHSTRDAVQQIAAYRCRRCGRWSISRLYVIAR